MRSSDNGEHYRDCPAATDEHADCNCEVNGVYCMCVVCRGRFSKEECAGAEECPNCASKLNAVHPTGDVTVKVNWCELQILACWAEQYASQLSISNPDMKRAIYAITGALEDQFPLFAPLTVGRELGLIKAKNPDAPIAGNIDPVPPKHSLH